MTEKKPKSSLRENTEAIIIAIIIAMFIRTFIIQAFKIPSGSMLETLQIGDQILVNKFIYGIKIPFTEGKTLIPVKDPQKGDIVVFKYPEDPSKDFIKRVVATGGDTLEIIDKNLYVNSKKVEGETYAVHKAKDIIPGNFSSRDNLRKIKVPENKLFVMGDNRDNSHDSRFWGFVDLTSVRGEAFIIYWSWNKDKIVPIWNSVRWSRIGDILR
ncbi:MAG: signal peptidase I [Desulfobacula sp.]|jgi:signal peptidase I|uniref:signal peptidase I n=1 Tax=Desulfobacula sp. TaxID=2593537 RepID=UPI001D8F3AB0|nr:signal peptidase I [Desulfobacula sp.]MBT3485875.1 signal peptidase I [Desulfobacula sp.]MBT3805478.1 signal peptidase I [Desulfobacula sp.]MBT4026807.1 signal peptidase I [Desulfobacula sp.]MBT4199589.1 signal peptidase I [Desulfobacula sp.]